MDLEATQGPGRFSETVEPRAGEAKRMKVLPGMEVKANLRNKLALSETKLRQLQRDSWTPEDARSQLSLF